MSRVEVEYRLQLVRTQQWIKETSDDRIWIKTDSKFDAFESGDLDFMIRLGEKICNDKHLIWNTDMRVHCTLISEIEWLV